MSDRDRCRDPESGSRDFSAVVVGAGSSRRFGGALPKQFHVLAGRSVLRRSVDAMTAIEAIRGAVVVLAPAELEADRADEVRAWPGVLAVVAGGDTRAASVRRGLDAAGDAPFVLVHDAARPLVGREVVEVVVRATREHGAAVPGVPVADTVKRVGDDGRIEATLDRSGLLLAQTPQGARRRWLVEALAFVERRGIVVTDEAAALEQAGHAVMAVPGDPDNLKITTPEDLERARRTLGPPADALRVGTGFDVHRFDATRPLVLGGLRFEGEPGLAGHSDADVVLHAAMDAVLGAAGMGDIGCLFPPDDPRFLGADSSDLARTVAARLDEAGFAVVNLDLTVLAERPRIRRRVDEMRRAVGSCFGIDPSRVGVKATTLEGLGALGRAEGIACQAVALVRRS